MLIVSNGAFKSGSTWLYNILCELTGFGSPESKYLDSSWVNPSIDPNRLSDLLKDVDYGMVDHLVKNHFDMLEHRQLLLDSPNIYIFNIERDIRDVLISTYFHERRINGNELTFDTYFSSSGKLVVNMVRAYHQLWDMPHPRILKLSYENLQQDFAASVRPIINILGLSVSDQQIEELRGKVTIGSLRKKYNDDKGFFRKGMVGDWANHLTSEMEQEVLYIYLNGLSTPKRVYLKTRSRFAKAIANSHRSS